MKSTCIYFLSLLIVMSSWADGIPVDQKGNITIPHSIINPTPSQVEEMEALDSITLSKEQWSALRKISPNTPKRVSGILPITWNDCTCGIGYGGVRLNDGQIAIFHEEQTPQSISWRINPHRQLTIHCDRRGQFYLEGILVRFPILLEAIRSSKPITDYPEEARKSSIASIEPPTGMSPTDPIFEDRIVEVYQALALKGWNKGEVPSWVKQGVPKSTANH